MRICEGACPRFDAWSEGVRGCELAFLRLRIPNQSFSPQGYLGVVPGWRCRPVALCGPDLLGLKGVRVLDVRIL